MSTEPVIIDTKQKPKIKMVPLFTIDDQEYLIPEKIPPNIGIKFLLDCARVGVDVALARAMVSVVGQDAMTALSECESVGEDELAQILDIEKDKVYSTVNVPAGKSSKGRRK
jgi:hypothetical protein